MRFFALIGGVVAVPQLQRKLAESCPDNANQEECEAECRCQWESGECRDQRSCGSFSVEADCCNTTEVYGGCMWADGECFEPDCANLKNEAQCDLHSGCAWTDECGGVCSRYNEVCSMTVYAGDSSACFCEHGDVDASQEEYSGCLPVACLQCLGGNASLLTDESEGGCAASCEGIFQCEEEAACYMEASAMPLASQTCASGPFEQCTVITKELADNSYVPIVAYNGHNATRLPAFPSERGCAEVCEVYNSHPCNSVCPDADPENISEAFCGDPVTSSAPTGAVAHFMPLVFIFLLG